ncbi:hypothetical protein [Lysobacter antibioticus]|uniref:hypothetical protein n=1 Tax=Lysobacter TaxID=68 RepID=UPI00126A5640|nr:hypothetical protein [Lysobacter antibioticus]
MNRAIMLSALGLGACLAVAAPQVVFAQSSDPVPMEFFAGASGYSDTEAIEKAIAAAKSRGNQAGYFNCSTLGYTWYEYGGVFQASATVVCYKNMGPPPTQPPTQPPPPPAIYEPVRSNNGADHTVSWSTPEPARYALEQSVNGGGWTERYKGYGTNWTAQLAAPANYRYRVKLITNAHEVYSGIVSIAVSTAPPPPPPPVAPSLVAPTHTVTWNASPSADNYVLERSAGDNSWSRVYSGPANAWTAVDMQAGIYRYRVSACSNGSCSAASGESVFQVLVDVAPVLQYTLYP